MEITELLGFARKQNASDLHLSPGNPPILRVDGDITPVHVPALMSDDIKNMLHTLMTEQQKEEYENHYEIDFAVHLSDCRYRINAFHTFNGSAAVFRNVPETISSLEELGVPRAVEQLCHLRRGLVLVTGPTGHGKTTTLASMIDYINRNMTKHIITIEDPIEFVHKSKKSLVNQREVGRHTSSFSKALRSSLREDPDIILVGELRDIETIRLALTAAETGHLVMGTLHTNSAAKTVDRIIDVFPAEEKSLVRTLLANTLEAILSQVLIKRATGAGRVAAFELLITNTAIANLLREGKIPQIYSLMQVGRRKGMQVMHDHIQDLVHKNIITHEAAQTALNASEISENSDNDTAIPSSRGGF